MSIEFVVMGFLTALGAILIMGKIGLKYFTQFNWQFDLLLSAGAAFIFAGTFSGMATGIVAGIFISLFLTIARIFVK